MRTSLHVIRGGPLLAMLVLLAGIPSARAGGHRFTVRGNLEAAATDNTAASPWLRVNARLSAPARDVDLLSGGDFVVLATLAESPLGCGSDIIFANGFESGI